MVPTHRAAGNATCDGEGRVCAVSVQTGLGNSTMTQYLYDADGNRVAKGSISAWSCDNSVNASTGLPNNGFTAASAYVLGPHGEQMTEMTNTAAGGQAPAWQWLHTNVMAPGLSATYNADLSGATEGWLYFHLSDWLGTRRQQTDYAGNPCLDFTGLPFGDGLTTVPVSSTGCGDATEQHFTGKERDAESGNDYFGARYFGSSMGRFMSPDEPFADFDPDNPQSWNLYAYVRNNPLSNTDPDGNDCVTQTRNSSTQETVSVTSGACSAEGVTQDGVRMTYVPGTVTGVSAGADGHSIDVGYTPYDGSAGNGTAVTNMSSAPDANNPGLAIGYGNNAQGIRTLGITGATVNPIAGVVMSVVSGFMGGGFGAGPEIASILPEETVVIGKVADLEKAALSAGERKLLLPNKGNPGANWAQNSSRLRSAMADGKPIRDVSAGNPGSNTGFLRAERNLLQSHGWTLKGEYWVPPGR